MELEKKIFEIINVNGGWLHIQFDNISVTGSYLTDLPIEWLRILHFAFMNKQPFCLPIDDEGTENIFVANYSEVFFYKPDMIFYKIDLDYIHFAFQVYEELCKYKEEWYKWLPSHMQYSKEREKIINEYFDKIDSVILLNKLK